MNFDWYKIINKTEFESLDLVSREIQVVLDPYGLKNILITKGNLFSVLIDDVFLSVELNDRNPFVMDERAIYIDPNNDVWVGFQVPEEI